MRQHSLGVGREWGVKDFRMYVTGGRRDLGISAGNVPLFVEWARRSATGTNVRLGQRLVS